MAYRNRRTDDRDKLAKIEEWRYHQVLLVGGIVRAPHVRFVAEFCISGVYVQGKCVIAIESRFGSKGNPSSQDVGARESYRVRMWEQGKSIESGCGSRDSHRVKIWEQGKPIESGCGSKGNPSSQDVGAGIAIESRFGSKGHPSSQGLGAGIVIESRFGSKE